MLVGRRMTKNKNRKLTLSTEAVRALDQAQLSQAGGALPKPGSWDVMCQLTPRCTTVFTDH